MEAKTMYEEILKDLKAEFGKKVILSTSDIAPYISKSPAAQYQLRRRGGFPFKVNKLGGKYQISIYHLAKWLADDSAEEKSSSPTKTTDTPSPKKKTQHRGISLGATLFQFGENINSLKLQVDFLDDLYRELEAIELEKIMSKKHGRKTKIQL